MDITPHKWQKVGDTFVFALNEDGVNEFDFFVQAKDKLKAKQVAALACAAPQLLEALELAKTMIEQYEVKVDGEWGMVRSLPKILMDGDMPDEYHIIIAAIAAAKGE